MTRLINNSTTVKQFIELSLFYDLASDAELLREAPRPDLVGGVMVPAQLDYITLKQRFILSEITNDIDYLFVPCETLLGLNRDTIATLPVLRVVGVSNHVVNELKRFSEAETALASLNPPSDDERKAGVEGLPRDHFAIVDAIVRRCNGAYTHDEVLNLTVADIYAMQKVDTYNAIFAKRLNNIILNKRK